MLTNTATYTFAEVISLVSIAEDFDTLRLIMDVIKEERAAYTIYESEVILSAFKIRIEWLRD